MPKKLTVDITDRNCEYLEEIKNKTNSPYGSTINSMLRTLFELSPNIKKDLLDYSILKMKDLLEKMDAEDTTSYTFASYSADYQALYALTTFLNDNHSVTVEQVKNTPRMTNYPIKNGYLVCPDDWIIVNKEDANRYEHAILVECRHHVDYEIPYFIYFCDGLKSVNNESLYRRITHVWPRFSEILQKQVVAVDNPKQPGTMLNYEEWNAAPNIYCYPVFEKGGTFYPMNFEPPFGTRIVHTSDKED